MADGKMCVPLYYNTNKVEDEQSSHIIIITSATNTVTFKNLNHTTSFYDSNFLSSK